VPLDSAVNIDFPRITAHFDLSLPLIQWVVVSYTLTSASLVLVFGRVGDIAGHRRIFLLGTAWSGVAFLLCAAAPGFFWLLGGRVLQGVGAGLVMSCGPALVTSLYPEALRPRAVAAYTVAFGIAGALGPVLGGLLLARFDWSSVFWGRAPIAMLGFALGLRLPRAARSPVAARRFDWAGAVLLVLALCGLLLALGSVRRPAWAGLAGAIAVLAGAAFARRESRTPSPIVQLGLFRLPSFALLNAGSILVNLATFAVLLLVPFVLASMADLSQVERGLVLAASPGAVALAAPLAGRVIVGGRTWPLSGGATLAGAGLLAIGVWGASVPLLIVGMLVQGLGLGLFQVAYLDRVTAALPRADRGVAGSLAMLTRTLGLVFGAAALMLLFETLREGSAFAVAFRGTFLAASALPLALGLFWALRSP
jgi:MFS family permease